MHSNPIQQRVERERRSTESPGALQQSPLPRWAGDGALGNEPPSVLGQQGSALEGPHCPGTLWPEVFALFLRARREERFGAAALSQHGALLCSLAPAGLPRSPDLRRSADDYGLCLQLCRLPSAPGGHLVPRLRMAEIRDVPQGARWSFPKSLLRSLQSEARRLLRSPFPSLCT